MSEPAKDFDLKHWKEVCYAHEVELECLRAENARLREALEVIASCASHYPGAYASVAREALKVKP
jgi:hypothetical protein